MWDAIGILAFFIGVPAFLVLGIIGLVKKNGTAKKRFIGASASLVIAVIAIIIAGPSKETTTTKTLNNITDNTKNEINNNKNNKETNNKQNNKQKKLKYEIVKKNNISTGIAKRFEYRVVIPSGYSDEQIKEVCKLITDDIKNTIKINALVIFFYDRKEDINDVYTVAKVEWAPFGEWGKASEVNAGEYEYFLFNNNFKLNEQSNKPTDKEFKIYDNYMKLMKSSSNPSKENPPANLPQSEFKEWMEQYAEKQRKYEEKCKRTIAEKYNISVKQVEKIFIKVSAYNLG